MQVAECQHLQGLYCSVWAEEGLSGRAVQSLGLGAPHRAHQGASGARSRGRRLDCDRWCRNCLHVWVQGRADKACSGPDRWALDVQMEVDLCSHVLLEASPNAPQGALSWFLLWHQLLTCLHC